MGTGAAEEGFVFSYNIDEDEDMWAGHIMDLRVNTEYHLAVFIIIKGTDKDDVLWNEAPRDALLYSVSDCFS